MKKHIAILALFPLLAGCNGNTNIVDHVPFDYTPNLPEFKNKDVGTIKEDEDYVYFDFYEISDFHGAVEYDKSSSKLGLERLSSYFDAKRKENPGGTFVLSSGDMWQGSADSNITRGNLVTYGMDVMNFTSMTLGNHEFDWTVDWIKNNKGRATFPFLAANLIDKTTSEIADFVKPSVMVTRGDYKIGIVGTIGENIKGDIYAANVANYDFTSEIDAVNKESENLRKQGCDIVVWTSHNDVDYLKSKISVKSVDVDLIFGGHSHTTICTEYGDIPMLEAKDYGRSIPHCQLKINKKTKDVSPVEGYACDTNPTLNDYSPDNDITLIYNQYNEKYIAPLKKQKLGKADGDFNEELLSNLAVESMFKAINKLGGYDIRACFTNINGGIRDTLKSGDILFGNIYSVFPFDNELVVMECSGSKFKSLLLGNVQNLAIYQNVYDLSSIDANKKYQICTTDFLSMNTKYLSGFGEIIFNSKKIYRDAVVSNIKELSTIKASDYKSNAKKEFKYLS